MFRSYTLSEGHYAAKWVAPGDDNDNFYVRESVNELAIRYANLPDGEEKESVSLQLIECFHGYLIKYVNMVIRGQMPNPKSSLGRDASSMLRQILPRGSKPDYRTLSKLCKSLHLAFKEKTTDDIYDTMVLCFLRACRKYDPHYTDKVRQICEVLSGSSVPSQFTASIISEAVGFDASGVIRMLVGKHFLVSIRGPKKKVVGYQRGTEWPPDASFFESGPIGFTYFATMWFRYYMAEHIVETMDQLESRAGVLQLGHTGGSYRGDGGDLQYPSNSLPHTEGNIVDPYGVAWAADTTLMETQFDISHMSDQWVAETDDRLFRKLTRAERWILQMVFRKEFSWVQVADALQVSTQTARQRYNEILTYLKGHAGTLLPVAA